MGVVSQRASRRGGTLTGADHWLLALWAARCAEHVLTLFESVQPSDARPRQAIAQVRAWTRGEIRMSDSRGPVATPWRRHGVRAARLVMAASATGQAAVVAHVAAHELGA